MFLIQIDEIVHNILISPHCIYCSSVLLLLNQNEVKQKKVYEIAKLILLSCNWYTLIRDMLLTLKWFPVQLLRYNTLISIFKIKASAAPKYLLNKIRYKFEHHQYVTKRCDFSIKPVTKKSIREFPYFTMVWVYLTTYLLNKKKWLNFNTLTSVVIYVYSVRK